MVNIDLCPDCGARVISEEAESHKCGKRYRLEGNVLYLRGRAGLWSRHVLSESTMNRLEAEGYAPPRLDARFRHPDYWTVYICVHC